MTTTTQTVSALKPLPVTKPAVDRRRGVSVSSSADTWLACGCTPPPNTCPPSSTRPAPKG
jgi:hypothetical protein